MMDGRDPAYERLDTRYHDFEHTLQGVLCLARLLKGWSQARTRPAPDERAMRLGLLGMLLHDTGYLKPRGDCDGTGAKYTLVHVERSAEFAGRILRAEALPASDIREVQNMIRCTGMEVRIGELPLKVVAANEAEVAAHEEFMQRVIKASGGKALWQ